jgi:hypothetical protein
MKLLAFGFVLIALLLRALDVAAGDAVPVFEPTPADLVRARDSGKATWREFCTEIRGRKIVWPLVVLSSLRQFGDDYMESGLLLLEVDAPADGVADVAIDIRPSQIKTFAPGQRLTLTGILRGCEFQGADAVARVEPLKIE